MQHAQVDNSSEWGFFDVLRSTMRTCDVIRRTDIMRDKTTYLNYSLDISYKLNKSNMYHTGKGKKYIEQKNTFGSDIL